MPSNDYYAILGVPRTASTEEIRRAYRRLARTYHPDVNKSPDAQARFTEIQEAYDVLSDETKRRIYDQTGGVGRTSAHASGPHYSWSTVSDPHAVDFDLEDLSSMFEAFFGGGPFGTARPGARTRAGQSARSTAQPGPVEASIEVDFLTAANGGVQRLRIPRNGDTSTIDVHIPKAVRDGTRLRIRGAGRPIPGSSRRSDLILTVHVRPHPLWRRMDDSLDLAFDLPLTIAEATMGARVTVPTPSGPVELTVPAGSASGQRLRLKGRGLEDAAGNRGDLFAVVKIVPPPASTLSAEQRRVLEQLGRNTPPLRSGGAWDQR